MKILSFQTINPIGNPLRLTEIDSIKTKIKIIDKLFPALQAEKSQLPFNLTEKSKFLLNIPIEIIKLLPLPLKPTKQVIFLFKVSTLN